MLLTDDLAVIGVLFGIFAKLLYDLAADLLSKSVTKDVVGDNAGLTAGSIFIEEEFIFPAQSVLRIIKNRNQNDCGF